MIFQLLSEEVCWKVLRQEACVRRGEKQCINLKDYHLLQRVGGMLHFKMVFFFRKKMQSSTARCRDFRRHVVFQENKGDRNWIWYKKMFLLLQDCSRTC